MQIMEGVSYHSEDPTKLGKLSAMRKVCGVCDTCYARMCVYIYMSFDVM